MGPGFSLFCWVWWLAGLSAAELPARTWEFREVTVRVFDVSERPLAGARVELLGVGRDAISARFERESAGEHPEKAEETAEKFPGWSFVTDAAGRFTARFGKFRQYDHFLATGRNVPGWGPFFFLVEAKGSAGGVSKEVLNLEPEAKKTAEDRQRVGLRDAGDSEWRQAPLILQDDAENEESIYLQSGLTVHGRVVDTAGGPVRGAQVKLFLDLGADTHTGRGGEIFEQSAETKADGRFRFEHVYPRTFYLNCDNTDGELNWVRTRVRERWVNEIVDEIRLKQSFEETEIPVVIVTSRRPRHRFFGRVTDATGRPVVGAVVRVNMSFHRNSRTYDDGHTFRRARTGRDGRYELRLEAPFVELWSIEAPDGAGASEEADADELDEPGEYDFVISKPRR